MATDVRGHTVPAGSDAFDPQGSDVALSLSISDFIYAANATDRASKVAAIGPTTARPVLVLQTDTGVLWKHDGANAWPLAVGSYVIGSAVVTAAQQISPAGSPTALTGMSVTATIPAGRKIRISYTAESHGSGAGDIFEYRIQDGGTVLKQITVPANSAGVVDATFSSSSWVTNSGLAAGSHTWTLSLHSVVGSGTCWFSPGPSNPAELVVEDLGAA